MIKTCCHRSVQDNSTPLTLFQLFQHGQRWIMHQLLQSQHGLSILLTLTIIAFMIGFMSDLMISTRVSQQMSLQFQERARAEYLAKSGEKLSYFILTIAAATQEAIQHATAGKKESPPLGVGDYHFALNGIPIGGENAEDFAAIIDMFSLSDIVDGGVIEQLKSLPGSFTLYTADESARINLSYLQTDNLGKNTIEILKQLLSCPAENRYLEEFKDVNAEELAYRIYDFIDKNTRTKSRSGLSSETEPYQALSPPFSPPNHPLVSVNELPLVSGWDDDIHAIFSDYITVFPWVQANSSTDKKRGQEPLLNINTISRPLLQCLFPEMIENDLCYQNFVKSFTTSRLEQELIASTPKDIPTQLAERLCYSPPQSVSRRNHRSKWFKTSSSTFRIISQGRSGDSTASLVSIVHVQKPSPLKEVMLYWSMDSLTSPDTPPGLQITATGP